MVVTGCTQMDFLKDKLSIVENGPFHENDSSVELPEGSGLGQASEDNLDELHLEASFFNETITVDGKEVIQNASNTFVLVNKFIGLPSNYSPDDLVTPDVPFSFENKNLEKSKLRSEAADALERMFAEAEHSGIDLYAISGYRSYERQNQLYNAEIQKVGEEQAAEVVATPGNSEHQTGLAMDISSLSAGLKLNEEFGETTEGKWLVENSYKYGFILRYPEGKEQITGYMYEPWHFRYVGEAIATIIYERDWTLEEYFENVTKTKDSV